MTKYNNLFVKKIVTRLERHGSTKPKIRGRKTLVSTEILDFIQ